MYDFYLRLIVWKIQNSSKGKMKCLKLLLKAAAVILVCVQTDDFSSGGLTDKKDTFFGFGTFPSLFPVL